MVGYCRRHGLKASALGYWKKRLAALGFGHAEEGAVPIARVVRRGARQAGGVLTDPHSVVESCQGSAGLIRRSSAKVIHLSGRRESPVCGRQKWAAGSAEVIRGRDRRVVAQAAC